MFDIGFPELMIVAVVMLLVLGPERLPETLRMLGLWLGRLRRSFNAVKTEIEKEVGMDEIKRQLHNEAIMEEMKRLEAQVRNPLQPDSQASGSAATSNAVSDQTTSISAAESADAATAAEPAAAPPVAAEPTMTNNPANATPATDGPGSSRTANNP